MNHFHVIENVGCRIDKETCQYRIPRVALVSIDTEGWDAFVMLGMERALLDESNLSTSADESVLLRLPFL